MSGIAPEGATGRGGRASGKAFHDRLQPVGGQAQTVTHGTMLRTELRILITKPGVFLAELIDDGNQRVCLFGEGI